MGYRLTKGENDTKLKRHRRRKYVRVHESGSVTSSIAGGGMKPCEEAISVRAAFGAWDSLILPCCGDRLLGVAIVEVLDERWPVSDLELGRMC